MEEGRQVQRRYSGFFLLLCAGLVMAIEEPNYALLQQSGDFELRVYEPMIVAETLVSGAMDKASNAGFRLIAGYIFGKNTSKSGDAQKISMTTPVTMEPVTERIAMTSPVNIKAAGNQWKVQFVMPSEYTMESLPTPDNPAVTLREVPQAHYAVVRFSGLVGEKKQESKTAELIDWMNEQGLDPVGPPALARYNPPWTLPFLRRNEIMIEYRPE
jgi:hypothetical protein